ncbi:hypothetical protein PINS_up023569 [Pythium insidiosum]|nr:hypothetical protein PINS_up023569 [Pythium insidiosum]
MIAQFDAAATRLEVSPSHYVVVVDNPERRQPDSVESVKQLSISRPARRLWWEYANEQLGADSRNTDNDNATDVMIERLSAIVGYTNVVRLDLSGLALHTRLLGAVLDVCSVHLRHVEALLLPRLELGWTHSIDQVIGEVFDKLYAAMERWRPQVDRAYKGLRQLCVPSRNEIHRRGHSDAFLTAVATYAPNVEFLDGWKLTFTDKTFVCSDEVWDVSPNVWQLFTSRCLMLREFSWIVVPFTSSFLQAFAQAPKQQLTRLQFSVNAKAAFDLSRDQACTQDLIAVVASSPALEVVEIIVHRPHPSDVLVYAHLGDAQDAEVFGDAFVDALVSCCPRLKGLSITEVGQSKHARRPIQSMTDSTLQSLGRAAGLQCFQVSSSHFSGDAAFVSKLLCTRSNAFRTLDLGWVAQSFVALASSITRAASNWTAASATLMNPRSLTFDGRVRSVLSDEWNDLENAVKTAKTCSPWIEIEIMPLGDGSDSDDTVGSAAALLRSLSFASKTRQLGPQSLDMRFSIRLHPTRCHARP